MYASSRLARRTSRSEIPSPYCPNRSWMNRGASGVECTKRWPSLLHFTSDSVDILRESSSAEPSAMIVPPARIRTRSANFSASSRSCVVNRIVVSSRSDRRCTRSWNSRLAWGSNPAVGSSRNRRSGLPTIPMATSILRRWPPERAEIFFPACSSRPTAPIRSSTA
jgi:hypothetical protein